MKWTDICWKNENIMHNQVHEYIMTKVVDRYKYSYGAGCDRVHYQQYRFMLLDTEKDRANSA